MIEKIYTHKKKGGHYRVLFISIGAGISRGQDVVFYQDVKTKGVYHRSKGDFSVSMIEARQAGDEV